MRVYATGVYIEPVRSINGKWHWEVIEFSDTTFDSDGKVMDPDVIANTEEELINKDIE
jgi:hypothetical protein